MRRAQPALLVLLRAQPRLVDVLLPQPEIQAYLRRTAERSGTLDRFRFDTTVESAAWDAADQRWRVRTSGGDYTVLDR